jgi:hypothetical protein
MLSHYFFTLFHTQIKTTMALRRPPTRIELKADDVEEYDKVRLDSIEIVSGGCGCDSSDCFCRRIHDVGLFGLLFKSASPKYQPLNQFNRLFLQIMKERRLQAEQQAMREQTNESISQPGAALLGASPSSFVSKKVSATERIGYRRPR